MDKKPDYVANAPPQPAAEDADRRPLVIDRIKQALLTSRLTLAGQSTGADPYNRRRDRRRTSVWGNGRR
jgi:hypothetical protein